MEDLIYLVILIAWAVFAFYRQSQKKKRAAEKAAGSEPVVPQTDQKQRNWEEILFGDESYEEMEPDEELQAEPAARMTRQSREPLSLEQKYMPGKAESLEDPRVQRQMEREKKIVLEEQDEHEESLQKQDHPLKDFDLRKAVIYSEILRRPYD
jgi:hypothetical protein